MRVASSFLGLGIALACAGAGAAPADQAASQSTPGATQDANADNTRLNTRDQGGAATTPQKQSNAAADRKLLAAVRRAVVQDKTLSTTARNVKIMAANGVVTLRGPVKSDDEKSKIETLAKQVDGVSSVDNRLDVKTVDVKAD
ncbi:MAG TPA: BON domain-containing protein [Janthinobacterium sp.]|jgi:osmotically-inducible protein OsmY|nr:BON domain-containing protein [Janthinobacterium sp.]